MPAVVDVATRLTNRCGNFKHLISAAVLAYDWLPAEYRETFMAMAAGEKVDLPPPVATRRTLAAEIADEAVSQRKAQKRTKGRRVG